MSGFEKEEEHLLRLLKKYRDGKANATEIQFVEQYFDHIDEAGVTSQFSEEDQENIALTKEKLLNNIQQKVPVIQIQPASKRRYWWAAASVVLLLAGTASYLITKKHTNSTTILATANTVVNEITPGTNKAVLVLGNGEELLLNDAPDGPLSRQGNTSVIKLADGQLKYIASQNSTAEVVMNTMRTPRGGQYGITLPDGTKVWLNAASTITYPAAFTGRERNVQVSGEAYFEVAKDASKTFKVTAGNTQITVLGTHFNVMAYTDEPAVKTTLLEGAVKVNDRNNAAAILSPGEQATTGKQPLTINETDVSNTVAWVKGRIALQGEDIAAVLRQIARWYDIDIVIKGNLPKKNFVGLIDRNVNLSSILKVLEVYGIHSTVQGKTVSISSI